MIFETILLLISIGASTALKCPDGYFQSNGKCTMCSPCLQDQVVRTECFGSSDTVCQCMQNHYLHRIMHICLQCKMARPGEIYNRKCGQFSDAKISSCPKEHFTNDSTKCYPCTLCKTRQLIAKNCTASTNTVCKIIPLEETKKLPSIGVIIGITTAVIFFVGVVFCCLCYHKGSLMPRRCQTHTSNGRTEDALHSPRIDEGRPSYLRCSSQVSLKLEPAVLADRENNIAVV